MTFQSWKTLAALAAFITVVGGFGLWWWSTSGYVSTDDARIKAEVVAVSAELTAKLSSLAKEEGDQVTRQEVLATLDRRELEILFQQADAEADRLRNKVAARDERDRTPHRPTKRRSGESGGGAQSCAPPVR